MGRRQWHGVPGTAPCCRAAPQRDAGRATRRAHQRDARHGGRDPLEITLAYRVLSGPGVRPAGTIDGERELFTGGDAEWVNDIHMLKSLGVSSVDVRLFGYGYAQTLEGTIDNMKRFRDGVLNKL